MSIISSATRRLPKFLPQFNSRPVLHFPQTYTSRCLYSSSSSRPLICRPSSFTINNRSTSRTSILRRTLCTTSPLHARYARFTPDPERPFDVRKWNAETRIVAVLLIGGLGYYIVHLERVPETGRWRFMDISPSSEATIAKQRHGELLAAYGERVISPDHILSKYVRGIVMKIIEANDLGHLREGSEWAVGGVLPGVQVQQVQKREEADGKWGKEDVWGLEETNTGDGLRETERVPGSGGREWTVMLVDDIGNINAGASFGNIIVFTGIFRVVKDDENLLAAVIGHEIGHVIARHSPERLSQSKILTGIALLLDALGLSFGSAQFITTLFLELPGNRNQEIEADTIGIKLMAKACFDPKAAIDMHERFDQVTGEQGGIEFLDTHPPSHKRIKHLQPLLAEAYTIQNATPSCGGMYETMQGFKSAVGW